MNLSPSLVSWKPKGPRSEGGRNVRLVHIGLAGVDEGLDMALVFRLGIEGRAGVGPDLTASEREC